MPRLSFAASIEALRKRQVIDPTEKIELPPAKPLPEDEHVGLSFFRTFVLDVDFSGLTLPRTFINRSEIRECRFLDTDLSESFICWNDLIDLDFTGANLAGVDLRGSVLKRVSFRQTDLSGADLRSVSFDECDFTNAILTGSLLSRFGSEGLNLSAAQTGDAVWSWFPGEPAPGG